MQSLIFPKVKIVASIINSKLWACLWTFLVLPLLLGAQDTEVIEIILPLDRQELTLPDLSWEENGIPLSLNNNGYRWIVQGGEDVLETEGAKLSIDLLKVPGILTKAEFDIRNCNGLCAVVNYFNDEGSNLFFARGGGTSFETLNEDRLDVSKIVFEYPQGAIMEVRLSFEVSGLIVRRNGIERTACRGAEDGQAEVIALGGVEPYTYLWDNGETTNRAKMLSPGIHRVTVSDSDGQQEAIGFEIIEGPIYRVNIRRDNPPSCFGAADGQLTANFTETDGQVTYQWSNGANTKTVGGLTAGTYSVTATHDSGCQQTDEITLEEVPSDCSDDCQSGNLQMIVLPRFSDLICNQKNIQFTSNRAGLHYWDFGDGQTHIFRRKTDEFVFHTYEKAGTYHVELIVEQVTGCIDTISKDIVVANSTPPTDFAYFIDGNTVRFEVVEPMHGFTYQWNLVSFFLGEDRMRTGPKGAFTFAEQSEELELILSVEGPCGVADNSVQIDWNHAASPENSAATCSDGKDNDLDGKVDFLDPNCACYKAEDNILYGSTSSSITADFPYGTFAQINTDNIHPPLPPFIQNSQIRYGSPIDEDAPIMGVDIIRDVVDEPYGIGTISSLAFAPNGQLWATTNFSRDTFFQILVDEIEISEDFYVPANLITIEEETGTPTIRGSISTNDGTIIHGINGSSFDPCTGNLFIATTAGNRDCSNCLYAVDTLTSIATLIKDYDYEVLTEITDLAFKPDGTLYLFDNWGPPGRPRGATTLFTVDPLDGSIIETESNRLEQRYSDIAKPTVSTTILHGLTSDSEGNLIGSWSNSFNGIYKRVRGIIKNIDGEPRTGKEEWVWRLIGNPGMWFSNIALPKYNLPATQDNCCNGFAVRADVQNTQDGLEKGRIHLNVIGGTAPFTYAWAHDTDLQTGSPTQMSAGAYAVTVTDREGCTFVLDNLEIQNITGRPATCREATTFSTPEFPISHFNYLGDAYREEQECFEYQPYLTFDNPGSRGAIYYRDKVNIQNGFSTSFTFSARQNDFDENPIEPIGEGMAFIIQKGIPNINGFNSYNGNVGTGLGYNGIPNSIAIEYDIRQNEDETFSAHINVHSNGAEPNSSQSTTALIEEIDYSDFFKEGQLINRTIKYDGITLNIGETEINLYEILGDDLSEVYIGLVAASERATEDSFGSSAIFELDCWSFEEGILSKPALTLFGNNIGNDENSYCFNDELRLKTDWIGVHTWDFGDGTTETVDVTDASDRVTKTYDTPGTYLIKAKILHPSGRLDSVEQTIKLVDEAIATDFTYTITDNSITVNYENPADKTFTWSFGDDTSVDNRMEYTHTYEAPGTYDVNLEVDGDCLKFGKTVTIIISGATTPEDNPTACADGIDNDGDGAIDCADSECDCCAGFAIENLSVTKATFGQADGTAVFTLSNGSGDYSIKWLLNNGEILENTSSVTNLPVGTHSIEIRDIVKNCELNISFSIEEEESTTPLDPIFEEFPWLIPIVTPESCEGDKITVYKSGIFRYLLVENEVGSILYFESGSAWCTNSPGLNCVDAYNLVEVVDSWTCSNQPDIDADEDGTPAETDPDDMDPCVPDETVSVCNPDGGDNEENNQIFIDYPWLIPIVTPESCEGDKITVYKSGIFRYLLVENEAGSILYFENGLVWCTNGNGIDCITAYRLTEVETVWDCSNIPVVDEDQDGTLANIDPDDTDPCVPDETVSVCNPDGGDNEENDQIFTDYPWLGPIVNPESCEEAKVTVYRFGSFNYLLVEKENSTILYLETGDPWCTNGLNVDCVEAYRLEEIVDSWNCTNQPVIDEDLDGTPDDTDPDDTDPCIPDDTVAACNSDGGNEMDDQIFMDYPWLEPIVNPEACDGKRVTVYRFGSFNYLLVEKENSTILYLETGDPWCTNGLDVDCVEAYRLEDIVATWECKQGQKANNRTNFAPSINEVKERLRVYPNPTSDGLVNIELPKKVSKEQIITVYDIRGKLIQQKIIPANYMPSTLQLDLLAKDKGIYLVQWKSAELLITERIILQ